MDKWCMGEYLIRGHFAFKTVVVLTFCIDLYDKFVFEKKKRPMWNLCRSCARHSAKEILEFKIFVNGVQNANVNTVTDKTF